MPTQMSWVRRTNFDVGEAASRSSVAKDLPPFWRAEASWGGRVSEGVTLT